ncbi:Protein of unknown function DUF688 [Dillenia turbinata]|uniref:Uncharacterized protein n=1 Tax=Dillenia turbinata TaxID=194707 RepID=A0AAN8UJ18_9MAGN
MEDNKKLNLNAPLMSARRYPSPLADRRNRQVVEKSVPNRQQSLPAYKLEQVTEPVAVPFLWEQIPGMPKSKNRQESRVSYDPSVTPRLPPKLKENRSKSGPIVLISNVDQKRERFNKATVQNACPDVENDDDDAYSDALDAFSELESLSLSCSVSGLSGSDGLDAKPCGTFFIDPQTRDLMMSRFLPAAKAMILETPLYVSKKQQATPELPRRSIDEAAKGRRLQLNQYGSNTIPQYDQDAGGEESEDEDFDDNDSVNLRVKACGLIPRFCTKNTASLLNTVSGVKVRTQVPGSSAKGNGRIPKTHHSGPLSQTVYKEMDGALKSPKLRDDSRLIGKHNSSNFTDSQTSDRLLPHKQAPHGRPPYKEVPKSLFRGGVGFLGMPKETVNYSNRSDGNDENHGNKRASGLASPAVEKTLYIDSVHGTAVPQSDSNFSDSKRLMGIAGNDLETPAASSLQIVRADVLKEAGILKPPSADVSNKKGQENSTKGFKLDQGLDDKKKSFSCSEVSTREKKSEPVPKSDDKGNFSESSPQSPLAPPLPKSPSESWLWRSLPSISPKKSFLPPSLAAKFMSKRQADKTSSTDTKWETIVKSSKVHYDHVRFSEVAFVSLHPSHLKRNLSHIFVSNPERPKVLEKPSHELRCGKLYFTMVKGSETDGFSSFLIDLNTSKGIIVTGSSMHIGTVLTFDGNIWLFAFHRNGIL